MRMVIRRKGRSKMPRTFTFSIETSHDYMSPMDVVTALCDCAAFDLEDLRAIAEHLQVEIDRMRIKADKYDREGRNE